MLYVTLSMNENQTSQFNSHMIYTFEMVLFSKMILIYIGLHPNLALFPV